MKEAEYMAKDRNAEMAKHWIPVEKGLPDPMEEDDVLVTFSGKCGNCTYDHCTGLGDYLGNGEWEIAGVDDTKDIKVLAWMPQPIWYEEEK
jgi:hypothetical protein